MNLARVLPLAFLVVLIGCGSSELEREYEAAIASGRNMEVVRQMEDTFPEAVHWISHFTQHAGSPIWYSEAAIEERYVFTLQVPVEIRKGEVVQRGLAIRTLVEVNDVEELPDGRAMVHYGTQWTISDEQWAAIIGSAGDFGMVNVDLTKGEPVKGFRRALNPLHWTE